jgi:hypothetical protein
MIEVIKGFANKGTSTQPHRAKAAYLRQRGAVNVRNFYNGRDKIYNLYSSGGKIPYAGLIIPFNIYINNNKYSPYKDFHKYINVW